MAWSAPVGSLDWGSVLRHLFCNRHHRKFRIADHDEWHELPDSRFWALHDPVLHDCSNREWEFFQISARVFLFKGIFFVNGRIPSCWLLGNRAA